MTTSTASTRTPVTMRTVVRRAVVTSLAAVAIGAAAFGTVAMLVDRSTLDMTYGAPPHETATAPPDVSATATRADAQTAVLIQEHDCWSSAAATPQDMRGRIPGHVVVTTVGSAPYAVYSADHVASALDEVFGPGVTTPGADLVVHAFCR
jgi:hypothetical protein